MEDHYKRMFNDEKKKILEATKKDIIKDYEHRCNKLKENISKCRSDIFERIKTKDAPSEEEKTQIGQIFYQVFKAYMINKNMHTMLKQNSLFVQIPDNTYFNNLYAMEEEALFSRKYDTPDEKNSFDKIEEPTVFLEFLQKRCEENSEKIELIINRELENRLLRERGKQIPKEDKEFLADCCDSSYNINDSRWKEVTTSTNERNNECQEKDVALRERLASEGATFGTLNFSLEWYSPNDLDLHVTCPCNSHIYFGSKRCNTCNGYLQFDMNAGGTYNEIKPFEYVYFDENAKVGPYKLTVNLFSYGKSYNGRTGGTSDQFILTVTDNGCVAKQKFSGVVSASERSINYEYNYSPGRTFNDHCSKVYPSWQIGMRDSTTEDIEYNYKCMIALGRIRDPLKKYYNL
ncbi:hypothetical protein RFI_32024 [Reticulomyxa filosa]|uniref:Uncharacterized protein n=1 Tax=Reticulomyxa filosa TaxID=46433 RepID=X6LW74_RETFI|nr:hypothetical protein RFI_32024 [Reticulomyxa filosa]|eukprot:ETO05372.1 hypothetical protein RFI_32024 [Reticulomyxa filosa]